MNGPQTRPDAHLEFVQRQQRPERLKYRADDIAYHEKPEQLREAE